MTEGVSVMVIYFAVLYFAGVLDLSISHPDKRKVNAQGHSVLDYSLI
jgi:hypothetical protein